MLNTSDHISSKKEQVFEDLVPRSFNFRGKLWTTILVVVCLVGLYFYVQQVQKGLVITGMRDYTTWGIYISNFVFFVAISLVGSLISAILKLSGAKWGTPISRIAEMIAVAAILFAALVIIIDMGRPDRFYFVILKARIQSPITWDVLVITTYLMISILLLYLPLLPDLALLRDNDRNFSAWQRKLYKVLALNWRNTSRQNKLLKKSISILAVVIIPVAFGIHTVTSWLFATTLRPGWDSTNFGPYFVSGAFLAGAAAVVIAMFAIRHNNAGNKKYITDELFNKMGKLIVLLSLVYLYFNINEYFVPFYKMKGADVDHLNALFFGDYAPLFWTTQIVGMIIPIIVLMFKKGRKPLPLLMVSILVVIGAWFKRFLIVIPTLDHPFIHSQRLPYNWLHYWPTFAEWSITLATLAGAMLIVTFLVRVFPSIPIVETINEDQEDKNDSNLITSVKKENA